MKRNNATSSSALPIYYFILIFLSFSDSAAEKPPQLRQDEVRALKEIGRKMGKKDWDFSKDPCSGEGNWSLPILRKGFESSVTCDCTFDQNSTCHVVGIALKSQNLTGGVPPEFAKLRHLTHLDLSRNNFNGSIPLQWGKMSLVDLSFMGNRLSGPFPEMITKMTTLVNLSLEGNQFSGSIPSKIGLLVNLKKLVLSSNTFTGDLPEAFSKLTSLIDLRINDNNFTGHIPNFISSWTQIEKLHMQGCSLKGPIPSSISALTKLTDLRISDLTGGGSVFPPLSKIKSFKVLILRSCLIHGQIPDYIADMKTLKVLDLSFNNLTGEIPAAFSRLTRVDFLYLTGNELTGQIPMWILERNKNADLSLNNFTSESSTPSECPRGSVNLVESFSSAATEPVHPCMRQEFPCSDPRKKQHYSLHINCGGKQINIPGDSTFDADSEPRGASMYYPKQNHWAFSSTGNFMDNDLDSDNYIATNVSTLYNVTEPVSELYKTARVSPLSLTYYGLCLLNGNYTVKLHFAEIAFTNGSTFNSLGRRIFDVYLQEKLVLKDFNIADEAGGPGKPLVRKFTVAITSHTLKIHLYWAGRGTTGIPQRGTYGPLISAISVDPNFKPPVFHKINTPAVAGGAVAGALLVALILVILRKKGYLGGKTPVDKELRGLDLQTGLFSLKQIKAATKNFDPENKGLLSDGTIIAVKQLSSKSKQGTREFVNEVGMISALQHPNLVKLYGCCVEGNNLMLIYEYMENNCVSRALFGKDTEKKLKLDWPTRIKVCLGIAKGLAFLHEESRLKIVHRDIKTSNVLLDKNLNAKISDFGLAKLIEDDKTHISTRIAGTIGYMAPEYAMRGYLTNKADVYSFGVVALEIISGKSNTNYRPEDFVYLLDWAYVLQERGSLLELVDPDLGSAYSSEEAMVLLNVALLCTNAAPTLRPIMSQVVSMLEGRTPVQDLLSDPGFSAVDPKFQAIRNHFWQQPEVSRSTSTNELYTDSSHSNVEKDGNGIAEEG
ncbi:probable LRR receptor-like serine/threonine-protein kinase At1g07650 isoform X2 [Andrographis paniculata]|uniref:probable LRR receptor-like serine/threonine-protein kinase At1g07650 isoform X2 n=1 Tax=Andrographis paniculata TaxID=175694 RepID=UPI0021E6FDE2|nr:probable LRR receptor-like serine/threonine-protein kinase At1g07650 isoform X2 [Andrographis paniculata]